MKASNLIRWMIWDYGLPPRVIFACNQSHTTQNHMGDNYFITFNVLRSGSFSYLFDFFPHVSLCVMFIHIFSASTKCNTKHGKLRQMTMAPPYHGQLEWSVHNTSSFHSIGRTKGKNK